MTREDFIRAALLSETDECILWPYAVRKSSGYAAHHTPGPHSTRKNIDAHRYVCILAHGEPKPDEETAHRCGQKLCINPDHVFWSDHINNMDDAKVHGTLRGGGRYRQRIFENDIKAIVSSSASHIALAVQYEVEPAYIGRLRRANRPLTYDL